MKNNDFEFVKNKFDNAQQDVPHSLDASVIEYKIMSREDHRRIKFDKKRNVLKPLAAAAACFVLALSVVFASNSGLFDKNNVAGFDNYEELNNKISTLQKVQDESEMGGGYFSTELYTNEEGVENPNTVKYYNGYLFYAYFNSNDNVNRNKVYIFKADNGNSKLAAIIDDFDLDDYEIQDLFAVNNRLVVNLSSQKNVITKIYDISNCTKPSLISQFNQGGKYSSSNVIDNKLFVFTAYTESESLPYVEENGKKKSVDVKNIAYFENANIARYAVINSIDIEKGAQTDDLKAVLGGSAKVHCTKDYIYINEYIDGEDYCKPERDVTSAMKLSVKNGKMDYASEEEIKLYSKHIIDIGRGDGYESILYPIGDHFISIGDNLAEPEDEIILFDKALNEKDSVILSEEHVLTSFGSLAVNQDKNTFALPTYFDDGTRRYYGVITFEIKNEKIVVKDKFINDDDNLMYQGMCVFVGDYIYSFDINDNAKDNEKLTVFSYKYR